MRLFVAVPAPEPVRAAAGAVIEPLRGAGEVRWVAPDRLHLTLRFLGEVSADRQEEIQRVIAETANVFSIFMVQCGKVGAFPTVRRPRTIWIEVTGEAAGRLAALAGALDAGLAKLGFAGEARPFQPHLTLGRVRGPNGLAELRRRLEQAAQADPPETADWPIHELHLMKSDLKPAGPVYTTLARFPLSAGHRGAEAD